MIRQLDDGAWDPVVELSPTLRQFGIEDGSGSGSVGLGIRNGRLSVGSTA